MLRKVAVLVTVALHWLTTYKRGVGSGAIVEASIIPVGDPNVAVGKISSQSSTFEEKGESRKAIDGSLANIYANGDCTLTKKDFEPWWMVDLISAFQVSAVVITNRGDCCEARIKGAEILIGDLPQKGGTMNPRCATINSMGRGETMSFNCAGMQGQYVTITIPGRNEFLSLCEVQVLAHPWLHIDCGPNPSDIVHPYSVGSTLSGFMTMGPSCEFCSQNRRLILNGAGRMLESILVPLNKEDQETSDLYDCSNPDGNVIIPGAADPLSLIYMVHDGGRSPVRDSETDSGLQDRVLSFLNESKGSFVVISPMQPLNLMEFTLCMRVAVEYLGDRKIILFSYHSQNDELRILREAMGHFGLHMGGKSVMFALPDLSTLGSHVCITWESVFGLTAFWMNGKSSIRKVHNMGHILQSGGTAILGQDQGAQSMSDQQKCRFVGEITDLYMWDYVLKSRDIQKVFQTHEFPRGNIFDWKILSYKIIGNVKVLPKY